MSAYSTLIAQRVRTGVTDYIQPTAPYRLWALGAGAILTLTYLSILYSVIEIIGTIPPWLYVIEVGVVLGIAFLLSRSITVREALFISGFLFVGGFISYLAGVSVGLLDLDVMLLDFISMLSGVSILRMLNAGRWVIGFTPAPIFLTWYCFFRSRYTLGGIIGGLTLLFFFFTGDLDAVLGLLGILGLIGVFGFGRLQTTGGTTRQRDMLLTLGIAILVVTTTVSLVPGGTAQPLVTSSGPNTIEDSIFGLDDEVRISGSVSTAPTVQFTVNSSQSAYWRADAYDRYTGDGWVLTGQSRQYTGELPAPETTTTQRVTQEVTVEQPSGTMPAVWQPVRVDQSPTGVVVTDTGGLRPETQLSQGATYRVTSSTIATDPRTLQTAGTNYPDGMEERYTQLPESSPQALGEFTRNLTANANNPYDTAAVIEQWLLNEKNYSLDVSNPSGNVAAQFLFEMDAGYCLYFATTMVAMLRSQDIPARMAVGYTTGQQVNDDTYVVRALNSHSWVEVYFPGHGWVSFDPTPAGPRNDLRTELVNEARETGEENVDTNLSAGQPATFTESDDSSEPLADSENQSVGEVGGDLQSGQQEELVGTEGIFEGQAEQDVDATSPTDEPTPTATETSTPTPEMPDRDTLVYGLILAIGGLILIHRTGFTRFVANEVWVRRAPRGPPAHRITGVFNRVEYLLRKHHRQRRLNETHRSYIAALQAEGIEPEVVEIFDLYEECRYAGRASESDADRAVEAYESLRQQWSPGLRPRPFKN